MSMGGSRNYLPENLPANRGLWMKEYVVKEQLDLRANKLIIQMIDGKVGRRKVLTEIERLPAEHQDFFRERLNYWREYRRAG
jgi:DNA polymerase-3 subunit theta